VVEVFGIFVVEMVVVVALFFVVEKVLDVAEMELVVDVDIEVVHTYHDIH
jgi:hypothetical protein